jgi:hypothetical protein
MLRISKDFNSKKSLEEELMKHENTSVNRDSSNSVNNSPLSDTHMYIKKAIRSKIKVGRKRTESINFSSFDESDEDESTFNRLSAKIKKKDEKSQFSNFSLKTQECDKNEDSSKEEEEMLWSRSNKRQRMNAVRENKTRFGYSPQVQRLKKVDLTKGKDKDKDDYFFSPGSYKMETMKPDNDDNNKVRKLNVKLMILYKWINPHS